MINCTVGVACQQPKVSVFPFGKEKPARWFTMKPPGADSYYGITALAADDAGRVYVGLEFLEISATRRTPRTRPFRGVEDGIDIFGADAKGDGVNPIHGIPGNSPVALALTANGELISDELNADVATYPHPLNATAPSGTFALPGNDGAIAAIPTGPAATLDSVLLRGATVRLDGRPTRVAPVPGNVELAVASRMNDFPFGGVSTGPHFMFGGVLATAR
jgi:hypothetical protein